MTYRRLFLWAATILAVVVRAGDDSGNLVRNGDFAEGLAHWQSEFPEPNETKYADNHKWVSIAPAPDKPGRAACMEYPSRVAASEGVKLVSEMFELDPDGVYEFSVETWSSQPAIKLFVEGYQVDDEQQEKGSDKFVGFARSYRCPIHVKTPAGRWGVQKRVMDLAKLRARYKPTHGVVKLYAYWPAGKVYFRNVTVRKIDPPKAD